MLAAIRFDPERQPVRGFTIGDGEKASDKILRQVADATQGRYDKGTPCMRRGFFATLDLVRRRLEVSERRRLPAVETTAQLERIESQVSLAREDATTPGARLPSNPT